MLLRSEQPQNEYDPIVVTELGIIVFWHPTTKVFDTVSIIALQLLRLSYFVLPDSTVMLVIL